MKRKAISVFLALLMALSCCAAGFSALAADDAALQQIAAFLKSAEPDKTETDHTFADAIDMLKDLSSDELIALGKLGGASEGEEFWWAGNKTLNLNRSFCYFDASASVVQAYCPGVYEEIAEKIPAYADFIHVLLDGVTVYALLIGEPTAEIPLAESERTPLAIGRRMAALPAGQTDSLKSESYFGSATYLSIPGITESLDEDKAKDTSIGALYEEVSFFGVPVPKWTTVYCGKRVLKSFCLAACFFEQTYAEAETSLNALAAFTAVIEGIQPPYDAADVAAAKEAYAAIPATAWSLADARANAARETYRSIVSANRLENNAVDLAVYQETDLGKNALSAKAADSLVSVLNSALDADEAIRSAVMGFATGKSLVSLLGRLGGLNDYLAGLFSIPFVASSLEKDPKFSGALKKLRALEAEGHDDGFCEYETDAAGEKKEIWSCADQFTSADFGFLDGDYYGFADALGGCLSGLSEPLELVSGFAFKNTFDGGNYVVGKYEDLIPLLELLDLPALSSAEFTAEEEAIVYRDAAGEAYTNTVRAGISTLLKPIANFLAFTLEKAPLDTLLELLPKAAYAIETGLLNDTVQKLLGSFAMFGVEVALDKDAIWNILDQKLVSGPNAGIDVNKDGKKEPVPLTKAQFDDLVTKLAGCAKAVVKPSVSIPHANRLGLEPRKDKVVSVLFGAVLQILKTEEGKAFADLLLEAKGASSLIRRLTDLAAKKSETALFRLANTFMPLVSILFAISVFFNRLKAKFHL